MILVTGSTGTVGLALLAALRDRSLDCVALVHSHERAEVAAELGAEPRVGDFGNRSSLEAAMNGVDRLFMLTPSSPDQVGWEASIVALAGEANVKRIVKLSVINADPEAPEFIYRSHGQSERRLAESGIRHTILRCNDFMQNLLDSAETITSEGRVYGTGVGDAGVAMVDVRDIAAAAAQALADEGEEHRHFVATGPEAISFDDAAAVLSAELAVPVAYEELSGDDYSAALVDAGLEEWRADSLRELYESYGEGTAAEVSADVRELTGSEPRPLGSFARDNADRLLAK